MGAVVFTNEGCLNCEDIKATLQDAWIRYKEYDAGIALNPDHPEFFERYPNWRELGFVDALALIQIENVLPVVLLDGKAVTYKEAKKLLQGRTKSSKSGNTNKVVTVDEAALAVA